MKRFLRHCKHALQAIGEHPVTYALICIELAMTLLATGRIFLNLSQEVNYESAMRLVASHEDMYVVKNRSEIYTIMNTLSSSEGGERCKELFDFVSEKTTAYIHLDAKILINNEEFTVLQVNKSFFHLYPFRVKTGRYFTEDEWNSEETEALRIPVIVGAGLEKRFPVGTELRDARSSMDLVFYVVGIFSEDAFYLNPTITFDTISLDQAIVSPWFPVEALNNGYRNVNLLHLMQVETEQITVLTEVAEKSRSLGLFDLDFYSYEEQIREVTDDYLSRNHILSIVLSTILLYCVAGSVLVLLNYIQHHMRSFTIHMLCGATKRELGVELLYQVALPLFIGWILSLIVYRTPIVFFGNLLVGLLLLLFIWIVPKTVWDRNTLSMLFKRYD